ncbi:hypothetical protein GIB67_039821 [Kingdonia uniflora]|uniref:Uncharacterized protein n=1 Tax=Kingdonia uniflora TaxID=39325 RepID=A0A7J7P3F5_9MAGN|nr:hypothetical protein GIB67_039821 [Kingdonia uniflora]
MQMYEDLAGEDKQKAKKKAEALDACMNNLSLQISCLALYKTDTEDKTLKFWEKIAEYNLGIVIKLETRRTIRKAKSIIKSILLVPPK